MKTNELTSLSEIKAIADDKSIAKAVEADLQQYFTDCLTPDRSYGISVDNTKKLMAVVPALVEFARVAVEALEEIATKEPWEKLITADHDARVALQTLTAILAQTKTK